MEDDSAGFGVEGEQMPFEGGDLCPAAGALLEDSDHTPADESFKRVRGGPDEKAANGRGNQQSD